MSYLSYTPALAPSMPTVIKVSYQSYIMKLNIIINKTIIDMCKNINTNLTKTKEYIDCKEVDC